MMNQIKIFSSIFVVGLVLDYLWIGILAHNFYMNQLGDLARLKDGKIDAVLWAAVLAYVLMTIGLVYFVLPKITADTGVLETFAWGALFGLVVYGVYDLTNMATLAKWPYLFSLVDTLWGTFLFGILTLFGAWLQERLS